VGNDKLNRFDAHHVFSMHQVDWLNHRRLLEPIGYVPPAEYQRGTMRRYSRYDSVSCSPHL